MRLASSALLATAVVLAGGPSHAQELPAGPGREALEAYCAACHSPAYVRRAIGYDRSGWAQLTAAMIDLSGDPESRDALLDWLAEHFPADSGRTGKQAGGELNVRFEQWVVPTLGQRARDPVEGPDGSIWWVGQWGDILGRLDPRTGEAAEFATPAGAKPHSVEIGPDGSIWYTGNKNATMGRLDPTTGEVEEFPMPDPAARDPHTAIFDAQGILWFTLQHSNMVGRLDPATGEVGLATAPTPGSRPYGIKADADGVLWVACNGSDCLLRIDPETMAVEEIDLPDPATTVRRLDIDGDGIVWWLNSSLGRLGRYDPRSGEIREWPSPSGPDSHPYAIAVFDGAVWYNESGVRPDMLVRFDPRDESFQSWPIPSGDIHAGILRHMRTSQDGKALLIHQTATNVIARVTVER